MAQSAKTSSAAQRSLVALLPVDRAGNAGVNRGTKPRGLPPAVGNQLLTLPPRQATPQVVRGQHNRKWSDTAKRKARIQEQAEESHRGWSAQIGLARKHEPVCARNDIFSYWSALNFWTNEIGAEGLACLGFDDSGYFEIGAGLEDDPAGLPAIRARYERAEIDAFLVDQSVAVDSHISIQRREVGPGYGLVERFCWWSRGEVRRIADLSITELVTQRSMLVSLIAACKSAQAAFEATDTAVDTDLRADLSRMIERSEGELAKLSRQIAATA
jgi:hypothetical protein